MAKEQELYNLERLGLRLQQASNDEKAREIQNSMNSLKQKYQNLTADCDTRYCPDQCLLHMKCAVYMPLVRLTHLKPIENVHAT